MPDSASSPPIRYWRYALRPVSALNARSEAAPRAGALLRIGEGHACVQPWPELGDATLDEQLATLARGGETPLLRQAWRCAERDAEARRAGRSLFDDLPPVPESHHLVLPGDEPGEVRALGFDRVKLKVGLDPGAERDEVARWAGSGFLLRLDANESLEAAAWRPFWESLAPWHGRIELVEDPCRYDRAEWSRLRDACGLPLATDREVESRWEPGEIAVLKPALSSWTPPPGACYLVSSYMDHALGQVWAASEAARLAGLGSGEGADVPPLACGLLTHRCYEPDPFFVRLRCDGPRLLPPGGIGLGFDDLLESLPWKRLI